MPGIQGKPRTRQKPCPKAGTDHAHGTWRDYHRGCKCKDTLADYARYKKNLEVTAKIGLREDDPRVPAGPSRERLLELTKDSAITLQALASILGTHPSVLSRVRRGLETRVRLSTENKILGYKPSPAAPAAPGGPKRIPAYPLERRLQALATLGWDCNRLSKLTGINRSTVANLRNGTIVVRTNPKYDAPIRAVYEKLWNTPPTARTAYEKMVITSVRHDAERRGWAPPMAWDEGAIDVEDATPYIEETRRSRSDISVDDLIELLDEGKTWEEAAPRAGYRSIESAQRAARRYREAQENQGLAA